MGIFPMVKVRAVVSRSAGDGVLEVKQEDGETLLLNLAGLGIDPLSVKTGDNLMLTRVRGRVQNVETL